MSIDLNSIKITDLNPVNVILQTIKLYQDFNSGNGNFDGLLFYLFIFLGYIWFIIRLSKTILETLASVVENLKKLGYSFISAVDKKQIIRRKQQFSTVLRADLGSIAKAENWNDQWFADLEAEVEAEGGYFSNSISRILNRRSNGIRRVPSLIKAIRTSTERCMLLVGEPGSGKSIALRHLARALADEGCKSNCLKTTIPLYINLRDLPNCDTNELNADFIKQFVLEHVRRGDADTAAYIRDNWQEFKEEGTWFFLFDSFDEIPSILHASSGSGIALQYSKALRQFMEGMGECRSVLASREYKGPEALPWHQLRILSLNQKRQDELIENTFLPPQFKKIVRQHLATSESSIFGNPLFLSLLCRYIGDNGNRPTNNHDLLIRHIERLSMRDTEYIIKKYGFTSSQLLEGATYLSVMFAEQSELGLAPTYTELTTSLMERQCDFRFNFEQLLAALVEVKICRSDVKEAMQGDRRVAFSHRRYQEALFVQFLAKHPEYISINELLSDKRWREFTVTLIQTQSVEIVNNFIIEAIKLLNNYNQTSISFPDKCCESKIYYEWNNDSMTHLLHLLNESLSQRLNLIPNELRFAISRQLMPRWRNGDLVDKLMVVHYGCLLPKNEYQEVLEFAICSNINQFRKISFTNAKYLGTIPFEMCRWIRTHFAREIVASENRIELHKLNALACALPKEVGAELIYNRCQTLRKVAKSWPICFISYPVKFWFELILSKSQFDSRLVNYAVTLEIMLLGTIGLIFLSIESILSKASIVVISLQVLLSCFYFFLSIKFIGFASPYRLTPLYILKSFFYIGTKVKLKRLPIFLILLVGILLGVIIYKFMPISISIFCILCIIIFPIMLIRSVVKRRSIAKHLENQIKLNPNIQDIEVIKNAHTAEEVVLWIKKYGKNILTNTTLIREVLCYTDIKFCSLSSKFLNTQNGVMKSESLQTALIDLKSHLISQFESIQSEDKK